MPNLIVALLLLCIALVPVKAVATSSGWQSASHLKAELVSEYQQLVPGQSALLALHFVPDEHWHTYWQNPGDSGLATSLSWQLPDGVTVGDIAWPTPSAIALPPLMNYGFEGQTILLSELRLPAGYSADTLDIGLTADWLVCEEVCIPASASFSLSLPVGANAVLAQQYQPLFTEAKTRLPTPLNASGRFDTSGAAFSALIDLPQGLNVSRFFVAATELVDHAADQQITLNNNQLMLQQGLNTYFSAAPNQLEVVLVTDSGAYSVLLTQAGDSSTDILITQGQQTATPLWLILLLAASGGLLLNLMPCVFPVLSLKALSLASNGQQRSAQQRDALLYSAGVVLSFALLALLLIALRAAGQAVGWGFQLQNPYLVALLVYLLFALGLSLSGVVQFGLGLMNSGSSLASAKGGKGAFFTGVLAVVVASPCTAPFMGTALGYAVGQSAVVALTVFVALGLGMALPFLLLAFVPGFARLLPKPGAWMESFKQWLAYPLYLSAVWLLWVYGRQTGIDAQALLLIGVVCVAAACWLWGRKQLAQAGKVNMVLALLLLLLALLLPALTPAVSNAPVQQQSSQHWQSWSAAKLQQLKAEGKPVLVNMTADWCITCLVNERVALNTQSSKAALALYDVTYLKGDWTLRDSAITEYLRLYQRDGVPLYVLYWPGQPPEVLPQILTPDTLATTLERLSRQL
ncbi:protein-disulfide reductase DsbD family protein [Rheinheimera nanhaiensis]|uniref:Thiol:disulfide interchange protein n=1 Tax=Rheinheimera nanhaiensis E407-8 TaxID=562729 RepID=I1E0Q9_9GAMM|nr:protein-disulfide reductase DsbD domain-containing protein [Rheinheimera nanhaiensis]GAB59887.1 thiol:disulfide interchange protein [Rheinheimera nanhaiensis E407-8]